MDTSSNAPETAAYWQAASEGRLLVKRCADCGRAHFYPRGVCPHCLSSRTEWAEASGRGRLYSYSHVARRDDAWTLAYVTLDEGVTMMTNLVDCDPAALHVGQAVRVVFRPGPQGGAVPMFTPV